MIDAQAVKFAGVWADNAIRAVEALETLEALTDWIVSNRYHLADVEKANATAWVRLRSSLHQRDADLRARIRHGVG